MMKYIPKDGNGNSSEDLHVCDGRPTAVVYSKNNRIICDCFLSCLESETIDLIF